MVDAHKVRISYAPEIGRGGRRATVEVDGLDVAYMTNGADLRIRPDEMPGLVLDLTVDEVEVDGEMTVTVPEGTAKALIKIGWTPPP